MPESNTLTGRDALAEVSAYINDPHGRIGTGFPSLDELLRRGGMGPGTLCLFGGRTRTRKTTVMCNMIVSMLQAGVQVGLVGLDEPRHSYIAKLMSVMSGLNLDELEAKWGTHEGHMMRDAWESLAMNFIMYKGYAPDVPDDLTSWLLQCEVEHALRPQVVFIDYTSKLGRRNFDGNETQRVERLIQRLDVWTKENELITIGLHQVGRLEEGTGLRYHGDTPMTLEHLRYGGESEADIVFGTYRPSLMPFGNMRYDQARQFKGESFKQEAWEQAKELVHKYQDTTFLQLIKNRPGVKVSEEGIPLKSIGETMVVQEDQTILSWDREDEVDKVRANAAVES